jgi:hypothetical protein
MVKSGGVPFGYPTKSNLEELLHFSCFFCFKITPQNPYPSNQYFNFYLGIDESILPFLSPFFLSLGTNCTTATNFFFFLTKHSTTSNKIGLQKNKNGFLSFCLPVNAEEQKPRNRKPNPEFQWVSTA